MLASPSLWVSTALADLKALALRADKSHLVASGLLLQVWVLQGTPLLGNPGRALGLHLLRNPVVTSTVHIYFSISLGIGRRQLQLALKAEQIKLFYNWFYCRESIRPIYSNQFWVKAIKESLRMSSFPPGNPADGLAPEAGQAHDWLLRGPGVSWHSR